MRLTNSLKHVEQYISKEIKETGIVVPELSMHKLEKFFEL